MIKYIEFKWGFGNLYVLLFIVKFVDIWVCIWFWEGVVVN